MRIGSRITQGGVALWLAVTTMALPTAVSADSPSIVWDETRSIASVADQHFGITAGDLNDDGIPDLAMVNFESNSVSVRINDTRKGTTALRLNASTELATGANPRDVAIGDINGDGKPDLAVANRSSSSVSVLINQTAKGAAQASFASKVDFPVGSEPRSVAIGDLNKDGKADLVVANGASNTVSLLRNTSSGGLLSLDAQVTFPVTTEPVNVAIADLNQDEAPEIVTANQANVISVLVNRTPRLAPALEFFPQQEFLAGGLQRGLAVGDLDGDGRPEIVVTLDQGNGVVVLPNGNRHMGQQTMSFDTPVRTSLTAGQQPTSVAIGNLDGDNFPDVVVTNLATDTVSIFLRHSASPSLDDADTVDRPAGNGPYSVALSDLNGDGRDEIVTANRESKDMSLLSGRASATAPVALAGPRPAQPAAVAAPVGARSPGRLAFPKLGEVKTVTVSEPWSLVLGDIDRDGTLDLIVSSATQKQIMVHLNYSTSPGGPMTFTRSVPVELANTHTIMTEDIRDAAPDIGDWVLAWVGQPTQVIVGGTGFPTSGRAAELALSDLDRDGMLDLVMLLPNEGLVSVWYNATPPWDSDNPQWTAPAFAPPENYQVGSRPVALTVSDFDGDMWPDIAVIDGENQQLDVLLNTTVQLGHRQRFDVKVVSSLAGPPTSLATIDLNQDGLLDLIVAIPQEHMIKKFVSHTGGLPMPAGELLTGDFSASRVVVGDVNGDKLPDIVAMSSSEAHAYIQLTGIARGSFTHAEQTRSAAIGDLDGDGTDDLLLGTLTDNQTFVIQGSSALGSAAVSQSPWPQGLIDSLATGNSNALAIGDLNMDTKPEICVANIGASTIDCYVNATEMR